MSSKLIALIPARMGSQRLKRKNLREIDGVPLITHAIRKCVAARVFDSIFVNSENLHFQKIAESEGVRFHQRPAELGNSTATSEQYIAEFLEQHKCERLVQVHSIAPLLSVSDIRRFAEAFAKSDSDVLLCVTREQIECLYGGRPINFSLDEKTNSQDLTPVERVTWSITGWKRGKYLEAVTSGRCATYHGKVGTFNVDRAAGHIIQTEEDLQIAQALWSLKSDE